MYTCYTVYVNVISSGMLSYTIFYSIWKLNFQVWKKTFSPCTIIHFC